MHSRIVPDIVDGQVIHSLPESATAFEAAQRMLEHNIAAVLVTGADGKLLGIVTERDMTRRVVAAGLDARATPLSKVMTRNPDTLAPADTARDALELMHVRGIRHLPVTQDDGHVVGMVSMRDLHAAVEHTLEDELHETEAFVFGERYGT
ncbi:MAG: CBS domain-containing protein [Magnetospirillum sp. WYHS-4]